MKLTKTEIRKKVEAICKKKNAYFMGPANFRDFLKDLKKETNQLISYAESEYKTKYTETCNRYTKALPPELRSQASMRKALEKQRKGK